MVTLQWVPAGPRIASVIMMLPVLSGPNLGGAGRGAGAAAAARRDSGLTGR